jgi:DNA-binding transcriptional ArsR family regulator
VIRAVGCLPPGAPHRVVIPGNGLPSPLIGKYSLTYGKECLLGDWTRRTILSRLRMGPKSVAQIAAKMKVSRPAVSQGLKILLEARLVQREISGRQTFYRLDQRGLEDARTYIEGLEYVIEKFGNRGAGRR